MESFFKMWPFIQMTYCSLYHYILLVQIACMKHWVICFEDYRLCAMTYMYFYYREDFTLFIIPIVFIGPLRDVFYVILSTMATENKKTLCFVLATRWSHKTSWVAGNCESPMSTSLTRGHDLEDYWKMSELLNCFFC